MHATPLHPSSWCILGCTLHIRIAVSLRPPFWFAKFPKNATRMHVTGNVPRQVTDREGASGGDAESQGFFKLSLYIALDTNWQYFSAMEIYFNGEILIKRAVGIYSRMCVCAIVVVSFHFGKITRVMRYRCLGLLTKHNRMRLHYVTPNLNGGK